VGKRYRPFPNDASGACRQLGSMLDDMSLENIFSCYLHVTAKLKLSMLSSVSHSACPMEIANHSNNSTSKE